MVILRAYREGLQRVRRFPAIPIWIFTMNFLIAVPLALTMGALLESSIGASSVSEKMLNGFDLDWYGEFQFQAKGLAASFSPTIIASFALLENLEDLLQGSLVGHNAAILGAMAAFMLVWIFFNGGLLNAYVNPQFYYSREKFFAANSTYLFRFIRLTVISFLPYYLVYRIGSYLTGAIRRWSLDVTKETTVLFWTFLSYLFVALLLAVVSLSFDYAKILTVHEDRRSMILAAWRGFQFGVKHWPKTFGLYAFLSFLLLCCMVIYALVAPGAGQSHWITILLAFCVGQIYIFVRILIKLLFLASQSSLFRSIDVGSKAVPTPRATPQAAPSAQQSVPPDPSLTQIK